MNRPIWKASMPCFSTYSGAATSAVRLMAARKAVFVQRTRSNGMRCDMGGLGLGRRSDAPGLPGFPPATQNPIRLRTILNHGNFPYFLVTGRPWRFHVGQSKAQESPSPRLRGEGRGEGQGNRECYSLCAPSPRLRGEGRGEGSWESRMLQPMRSLAPLAGRGPG